MNAQDDMCLETDYCLIKLNNGEYVMVDSCDYGWLSKYSWTVMVCGDKHYAKRATRKKSIQKTHLMHREILGLGKNRPLVDHVDMNGLNNRRSNLRTCGHALNSVNRNKKSDGNSSRFKGVSFDKRTGKWSCILMSKQKHVHLGRFEIESDAAKAYDKKAIELWGDFARTNKMLGLL